ncbi:winged helix-turn-helix domain-containing protein [Streptomyces sp. NPDC001292]|uniref:winged helix-turn-helix domain-containing protein n=1 Tax=Streptomyces sp. NPDC001292 TaxID=3364558 RepID=UPI0036C239F6
MSGPWSGGAAPGAREDDRNCVLRGTAERPKADDRDFAVLEPLLLESATALGWADERWTLSRVQLLIADQLGVTLSIRGVW